MNDDVQFLFSLVSSTRRLERRLNGVLSNVLGVSFSEYFTLRQLETVHGGAAARRDLASSVQLTASAVTRALKPLEKIGYIGTQKNERDARQSIATLTNAGRRLIANADRLIADEVGAMGFDEADVSTVMKIFKTL